MSTLITSKKGLIDFLSKDLDEDVVIAFTQAIHGQLGITDRGKVKSIPFGFSSEVFKKSESVGDIVNGNVLVLGIAIMPPEHASDVAKELYKQEPLKKVGTTNREHLQWLFDRLVEVHGESPNLDYMHRFKKIINEL